MTVTVWDSAAGKPVDVPEETVADGYRSGRYRLKKGQKLSVVDRYGNLGQIDSADAAAAFGSGFEMAAPGAFEAAAREERYSTPGQIALTAAEGAGKGLSLGLSEGALGLALGDEYKADAEARAEVNPVTSIGGEVAGAVAPLILSGGSSSGATGTSLAGRAVRGVGVLPRLAARDGLVAEAATAGALGEGATAGGRILRAIAAKGVGAAAESLPYAVGRGISTAALDDDASAQRVLAQIGLETMAGGLAGGILGGAGRATSEGFDAAAQRLFGDAAHPGLGKAMVKISESLSGDDATALSRLALGDDAAGLLSAGAKRNRRIAYHEADAIRERVARDLTGSLDDAKRAMDDATAAFRGDVKTGKVAALLPKDNAAAQVAAHEQQLTALRGELDDLLADRSLPWRSELRELRTAADTSLSPNPAKSFTQIDKIKRQLQSTVSAFGKAHRRSDVPRVVARGRDVIDVLEGSSERMRTHLMDDGLFGAAAAAQREINEPWARMIAAGKNLESKARLFRTIDTATPGKYTEQVADPEAINRYLGTLTDPNKDMTHAAMREWLEQGDAFVSAVAKHGGDDPKLLAAVEKYKGASKTIRAGLAEAEDAVVLGNQAKALTEAGGFNDSGGNMIGAGAALALDSLAPLGASAAIGAVKKGFNVLATPGKSLRKLAAIERLAQRAGERLDVGLGKYLKSIGTKAAKRTARVAPSATLAGHRALYQRTRERLEASEHNPEAGRAAVERSMAPVGSLEATAAMVDRVRAADAFLAERMPRPVSDNPWRKVEPTDAEVAKFARYVAAADDPVGTLTRELDTGNLSRETMETVRELYPDLNTQIVAHVSEHLSGLDKSPPYEDLVRLSLLLDTPLDPSMRPERISQLQDSYQYSDQGHGATKPKAPPKSSMSDISKSYETTTGRLSS